jgi:peptidyl-prolyl cis-trans isomerase A (cyclophilin A)
MKFRNLIIPFFFLFVSCVSHTKQKEGTSHAAPQEQQPAGDSREWIEVASSIAKVVSYDGERILESGRGFFVAEDLLVTKYSLIENADNVQITPLDENKSYKAIRYVAFDRINELIILKVESVSKKPVPLFQGQVPMSAKTFYITRPTGNTIPLHTGKVLNYSNVKGNMLYKVTNSLRSSLYGTPLFVSNKKAIGIGYAETVDYERQSLVIPARYISEMLEKKESPKLLDNLKISGNNAVSEANSRIKGLLIETDRGNITIRLFNETPAYRDNFIRLTREGYYDSLLIHRVIKGFGIQSGAADTRYATRDDVVGWKGPGYTIPAHIVPSYFHKRGMIGSPRKPDTRNSKHRSDGSQFYIVSGRRYTDSELNDLETENRYTFSAEQRRVYKTIGGAPHLDGSYTLFGEVTSGMAIVDHLSKVEVDRNWRPLEDIRIKKITIIE